MLITPNNIKNFNIFISEIRQLDTEQKEKRQLNIFYIKLCFNL